MIAKHFAVHRARNWIASSNYEIQIAISQSPYSSKTEIIYSSDFWHQSTQKCKIAGLVDNRRSGQACKNAAICIWR